LFLCEILWEFLENNVGETCFELVPPGELVRKKLAELFPDNFLRLEVSFRALDDLDLKNLATASLYEIL